MTKIVTARTSSKNFNEGKVTAIHLDEIGRRQRRATEAYSKYAAKSDEADDCQGRQMGGPLSKMKMGILSLLLVWAHLSWANSSMEKLYQLKCASCHGQNAEGLKVHLAPRLRGQYDWYIIMEFEDFMEGSRKHPKKGNELTPKELKQLATYLHGLK
ncbi:MAG: cytochrome c [Bacteriovoracales bacterium]|nr:cytochrome c [Bacteriovoracales bacterium]